MINTWSVLKDYKKETQKLLWQVLEIHGKSASVSRDAAVTPAFEEASAWPTQHAAEASIPSELAACHRLRWVKVSGRATLACTGLLLCIGKHRIETVYLKYGDSHLHIAMFPAKNLELTSGGLWCMARHELTRSLSRQTIEASVQLHATQ